MSSIRLIAGLLAMALALLTSAYADTNDGLVGHWSFDSLATPTTTNDHSGNGNTASLVNGPTLVTGKISQALNFDGINDQLKVSGDLIGTGPVTVTAWINPRSFGANDSGVIATNGRFRFNLRAKSPNSLDYRAIGNVPSGSAANSIVLNTWQFIVLTRTGTTANFYINGQLSGPANQVNDTPLAGTDLIIGNRSSGDLGFNGLIDEVRVYNRVLSVADIQELYNDQTPVVVPPPVVEPPVVQPPVVQPPTEIISKRVDLLDASKNLVRSYTDTGAIQRCAAVAVAGQTCLVHSGTYDERVIPANSGTSDTNRITFLAASGTKPKVKAFTISGKNYITIEGFEVTNQGMSLEINPNRAITINGGTGIRVMNNYIHDTTNFQCILSRATFSVFSENEISYCGVAMSILGTATGPKTITAGVNDQVKFSVQGGPSQTITLPAGVYNGTNQYAILRDNITPPILGAALVFGATGRFEIRSLTVSPDSSVTLEPVANNAYATFGWTVGEGTMQGLQSAFTIAASDQLVEDNKISHVGDYVTTAEGAQRIVIRNNTFGPADLYSAQHIDGIQSNSALTVGTKKLLFEGNISIDNRNADNHMALFQQNGDSNLVLRYNVLSHSNGGIDCTRGSYYGMTNTTTPGLFLYQNTFYNNALYISSNSPQVYCRTSSNNYSLNNIWHNSTSAALPYPTNPYSSGGYLGSKDYDLWYLGGSPSEPNAINADPLFVNALNGDFHLQQASSPAVDKGGALTKTSNTVTHSTTVTVEVAGFFQDGWGGGMALGVVPDGISIGSTANHAQILSINYDTNTITLASALSWKNGDPVWLYSNSRGERVLYGTSSDIGANEFIQEIAAPAPTPIPAGSGDVSGDGKVTMYDASLVLRYTLGGNFSDAQKAKANINADKNSDGTDKIDGADVVAIARKALGL